MLALFVIVCGATFVSAQAQNEVGMPLLCTDRIPICSDLASICMGETLEDSTEQREKEKEAKLKRYKHSEECARRRRKCFELSDEADSKECDLHKFHCCPCSWHGCSHCFDTAPRRCKNCDKLKKLSIEMIQRLCPHTCDTCGEKYTAEQVETAAEEFVLHFLNQPTH